MKMIRAVVRPEKEDVVMSNLEKAGIPSMTKLDVLGRGKQKGIQVGATVYEELAKTMILVVVEDAKVQAAVEAIQGAARTGNFGDGKIFVSSVEEVYTIRTGKPGL